MDQIALNALLAEAGIPATVKDVVDYGDHVSFTLNSGLVRTRGTVINDPAAILNSVRQVLGLPVEDAPAEKSKKATRKRKTASEGE